MTTYPRIIAMSHPALSRLGEAQSTALALAQAGSPPAAIIEHLVAAVAAGKEVAAELEAPRGDLAGRVAAARLSLDEAGYLLELGHPAEAWAAVLQAAEALERPAGLSQQAAALRAAQLIELHAGGRDVAVQSAAWDAQAGRWRVEVAADGLDAVWAVGVAAGAVPEVLGEL